VNKKLIYYEKVGVNTRTTGAPNLLAVSEVMDW